MSLLIFVFCFNGFIPRCYLHPLPFLLPHPSLSLLSLSLSLLLYEFFSSWNDLILFFIWMSSLQIFVSFWQSFSFLLFTSRSYSLSQLLHIYICMDMCESSVSIVVSFVFIYFSSSSFIYLSIYVFSYSSIYSYYLCNPINIEQAIST